MKYSPKRDGASGWLLQRITAALLLFALGAHLWALHLVEGARKIDFEGVLQRLSSPFFIVIDIVLVGLVLYHGLYGLRGIIYDLVAGSRARAAATWFLMLLGLSAFLLAIRSIMFFLS